MKTISRLYLLNLSALVAHQIDSAFWHEWELFGLPGGIQFFVFLNFILVLFFLYGFQKTTAEVKFTCWYSLVLAGSGIFAFVFHGYQLLLGKQEFSMPMSKGILALVICTSVVQAVVVSKELIRRRGRAEVA